MPGESIAVGRRSTVRIVITLLTATLFLTQVGVPEAEAGVGANERYMVKLINRARVKRGLPALRLNHTMTHRARKHSAAMRERGVIYHSNLRRTLRGISWRIAGENVGMGPDIKLMHRAFMRSSGHRANILLRSYRHVGVGISWRRGIAYVTVLFKR